GPCCGCRWSPAGAGRKGWVETSRRATDLGPRSLACENDVPEQRVDLVGPAIAAEHAVVSDPRLHMVALEIRAQARAQLVRGRRLSDGADVVALAFSTVSNIVRLMARGSTRPPCHSSLPVGSAHS